MRQPPQERFHKRKRLRRIFHRQSAWCVYVRLNQSTALFIASRFFALAPISLLDGGWLNGKDALVAWRRRMRKIWVFEA